MDKTGEFERYLKDGIPIQESQSKDASANQRQEKESIDQMIYNL